MVFPFLNEKHLYMIIKLDLKNRCEYLEKKSGSYIGPKCPKA